MPTVIIMKNVSSILYQLASGWLSGPLRYGGLAAPSMTVVASRDQILPHEDSDAAAVLVEVFAERGVTLVKNARADSVTRTDTGVKVTMADGRSVEGSHALMTVGSVPNTANLGLERVGVELKRGGYIPVDRVSRTPASTNGKGPLFE